MPPIITHMYRNSKKTIAKYYENESGKNGTYIFVSN